MEKLRRIALWKVQSRYVQERNETAVNRLDLLRDLDRDLDAVERRRRCVVAQPLKTRCTSSL
jgi:hypothetical protein